MVALIVTCLLLLWQPEFSSPQRTRNYQLEDSCFVDPVTISLDETVIIKGGGTVSPKPIGIQCKITVRTEAKYELQARVQFFNCREPSVILSLYANTNNIYNCDNYPRSPLTLTFTGTQVIVDLKKGDPTAMQYSFDISITPRQKPFSADTTESQPVAAGLIVGIVCGIFFFLVVGAIIIACCYRRAQKLKRLAMYNSSNAKVPLEDAAGPMGISNNFESSPRAMTRLLTTEDESVENGGVRRPQTLDLKSRSQTAKSDRTESSTASRPSNNDAYEHEDEDPYDVMDGDPKPPKSPFLGALQSNAKFQKSRQENERDAEDRRNRLSGSSFGNQTPGSNSSIDSRDKVSASESRGKPLPAVPDNKQLTLAEKRKKMESFRRATRPDSFTSDELDRSGEDTDNLNKSRGASGSDSQSSHETAPAKAKTNTQHILRPNRGQEKTKNTKNKKEKPLKDRDPDKIPDSPKSTRSAGQFQKLDDGLRSSKRSNKSPKPAAKGFGHRRNRSTDSRPVTPTSMMRDDDEESIRPLQRTTSRQSLYASRSSLYSRRRRKGSFSESVVSGSTFAHDDIDYYRRPRGQRSRGHSPADYDDDSDGYVQPISRHENDRMFKSLGDLNSNGRRSEKATRATQTLRETATQTGDDQSVVVHSKRVVPRKRRSKSLSATGTQTTNKKHRSRSKSRGNDSDTGDELKNEKREKSKSRESLKESSEKPKPKPKPKPRKSQSAAASESEAPTKAQRKKSKSQKEAPAAEDTVEAPQELTAAPPGVVVYPMGPQGQPYVVPYGLPPGYTTLPLQQPPPGAVPSQPPPYVVNGQGSLFVGPPPPVDNTVRQLPPQTVSQAAAIPRKKSNWEMLCEMTDKQNSGEALETGSVTSSVFTNNIPSHQVVYPTGHHPAAPIVMVPPQHSHPVHSFTAPGALYPSGVPLAVNPSPLGTSPAAHPSPSVGSELSHNSSWDVLTRLTEQQSRLQQGQNNAVGNESVV
ncbi:serine/arginine repetitive matrix protein 1-like [Saccostrea cucullata]|uniref:serine/arginine repetitive matrix protein 1-like n=1 Tax=Saccostrea cuccullata TaxID=36930 RepID=UPI002ED1DE30